MREVSANQSNPARTLGSQAQANAPEAKKFRLDIEGLRGLSVAAVIANHFSEKLAASGYLGVDVFFVISGFVITQSLARRSHNNLNSFLLDFYDRRVRRLLPSLAIYIASISIVLCLFDPSPGATLRTGMAAIVGFANISLYNSSIDYFAGSTTLNPFVHAWSLAVEEQFYLLYPILAWTTGYAACRDNGNKKLLWLLSALLIASMLSFLANYGSNQTASYFLTPPRFWELASGCILALTIKNRQNTIGISPRAMVLASTSLAALTILFFAPHSLAPASNVIAVVLAMALIALTSQGSIAYRILSSKCMTWLGKVSYSLYLWHWGILAISRWTIGISLHTAPFQLGLMLLIASCSYMLVESPLRQRSWADSPGITIFKGIVLAACTNLALLTALTYWHDVLYLGSDQASNVQDGVNKIFPNCVDTNIANSSDPNQGCRLAGRTGQTIIAIGDSQTKHLAPLLEKTNKNEGLGIIFISSNGATYPGVPEARSDGRSTSEWKSRYRGLTDRYRAALEQAKPGDIVLLSSRFELRWGRRPIPEEQKDLTFQYFDDDDKSITRSQAFKLWQEKLYAIAKDARDRGLDIIIFNSLPTFRHELPPSITNPQWFNRLGSKNFKPEPSRKAMADNYKFLDVALTEYARRHRNVEIFDLFTVMCPSSQAVCSISESGNPLYSDQWHLSSAGAIRVYPEFKKLLQQNKLIKPEAHRALY